jgi:hypothetical protein
MPHITLLDKVISYGKKSDECINFFIMSIENQITFYCHMKRGGQDFRDDPAYELVQFVGYFRKFKKKIKLKVIKKVKLLILTIST